MRLNRQPTKRIIDSTDPITNKRLVHLTKRGIWTPNANIPRCRPGEEERVENYELAKSENFESWQLHHRLELTLDGDVANSMMDLINMDMYFYRPYFELIWLRREEHISIHHRGKNSSSYKGDDISPATRRIREKHGKPRRTKRMRLGLRA